MPKLLHILSYITKDERCVKMINNIFEQFGADVDVSQDDVIDMADDAVQADLTDDEDVRNLIRSIGAMVGREIDPEIENKLTEIITSGEAPTDMASLMEMMTN